MKLPIEQRAMTRSLSSSEMWKLKKVHLNTFEEFYWWVWDLKVLACAWFQRRRWLKKKFGWNIIYLKKIPLQCLALDFSIRFFSWRRHELSEKISYSFSSKKSKEIFFFGVSWVWRLATPPFYSTFCFPPIKTNNLDDEIARRSKRICFHEKINSIIKKETCRREKRKKRKEKKILYLLARKASTKSTTKKKSLEILKPSQILSFTRLLLWHEKMIFQ